MRASKRNFLLAFLFTGCFLWSCLPDQERITTDPDVRLRFSSDSVAFDTVFTAVNSITRRLKVYNDSRNAVEIDQIRLGQGLQSPFSLTVNGEASPEHDQIRLLGGDSLLILVDINIDPRDEDNPYLVTDKLQFDTNGNLQDVDLVAYGQDAIFINGEILACNTTFTSERPYVIYNSLLVDSLCSLIIEPGTRIYSHNASYIFVQGSIIATGTTDEPIEFSNDRFDENFINAPGQWGGIVLLEGSQSNIMDWVKIRNARVGIYVGTPDEDEEPDIVVSNSVIENMGGAEALPSGDFSILPGFGILAFNSDVASSNVLINNCEVQAIGNYAGGNYQYEHCTLANFSFDFFRQSAGVLFSDNLVLDDNSILENPLKVTLVNSIVWGNLADEIEISIGNAEASELIISNNLIRTQNYRDLLEGSNLLNIDPEFVDAEAYNYRLQETSAAIDAGLPIGITYDLDGNIRDENPDLGAYEKQQ